MPHSTMLWSSCAVMYRERGTLLNVFTFFKILPAYGQISKPGANLYTSKTFTRAFYKSVAKKLCTSFHTEFVLEQNYFRCVVGRIVRFGVSRSLCINQEGVINSSARLSDVSGHRDVTAKWSVRREDFRKWRCFRFLCCHLQNVFLPFGKRQDEFHLIEEVLHLIFQLQRYVDFHNCFKISQKNFLNVCSESSPFAFCVWAKPHVACKFCRYFLMGSMGHLVTWS